MTVIADRRGQSPGTSKDPGTDRARRSDAALFYSGLLAATVLLVFGTLAVMAVLPMIVPGYTSASITSGSMMPILRIGDVVIAADHGGAEIAPDTIVVYEDPRKHDLVTHRVVAASPDGSYVTKGDVNGTPDPKPIPTADVVGEARWIVPFIGLPRVWVAQRQWTPLVLMIVVTALALWLSRFAFDARCDPWRKEARTAVEDPRKHDLVTHWAVAASPDGSHVTKGDVNGAPDPKPIPTADVVGKARWIVPFVGLPRVWVAQRQWTPLVLMIAVTALALWLSRFAFDAWRKEARTAVEDPP